MRNLLLTGGIYHDFKASAPTLADVLSEVGITSDIAHDIDAGVSGLSQGYDLLTVYALRWSMPQEKFADQRQTHGYSLGAAQRQAIQDHVAAGRGVLVVHTGAICFDDWPAWRELVGAGWAWGHSYHPPLGQVGVRPTARAHDITTGLQPFEFDDEAYTDMDCVPGLEPLAEVKAASQDRWSPCLWARDLGSARLVFDALGHDSRSLDHPQHRRVLQRSALWALRQPLTSDRP